MDTMGLTLETLDAILHSCPQPFQRQAVLAMEVMRLYAHADPTAGTDATSSPTPALPRGDWATLRRALREDIDRGVPEERLVARLFLTLDRKLEAEASEAYYGPAIESLDGALRRFEQMQREDAVAGEAVWEERLAPLRDHLAECGQNRARAQNWLSLWRRLAPVREAHRVLGTGVGTGGE
jgi:hypothetical protein